MLSMEPLNTFRMTITGEGIMDVVCVSQIHGIFYDASCQLTKQ